MAWFLAGLLYLLGAVQTGIFVAEFRSWGNGTGGLTHSDRLVILFWPLVVLYSTIAAMWETYSD